MNNAIGNDGRNKPANIQIRKETKSNQYNNMFASLLEVLTGDKPEFDKIKGLILLEQDYQIAKEKKKMFELFKVLSDCFNQTEFVCSAVFKGQILMTSTTLLIILDVKNNYPSLFHSFIDNVLIEHLKNTSNQANLYLRQITCLCLEEFEIEYPGMMFGLMGQRTLEIIENGRLISGSSYEDMKSIKSCIPFGKRMAGSVREGNLKTMEYKRIELANDGLYILIEEEKYYVFQYYLMLYTRILNHVIMLYIENTKEGNCNNNIQVDNCNNTSEINIKLQTTIKGEEKEIITGKNIDFYEPQKTVKNFGNSESIKNNQLCLSLIKKEDQKSYPFTRLNKQNLNMLIEQNSVLHLSESNYQNYIDLFDKAITSKINNKDIINTSPQLRPELLSYINKALSHIIHLLPKISELIKVKIWGMLSYIISTIEINQLALLPHFDYFHLNNSSQLLTLIIIPIIGDFKSKLKSNFILKLILKLCLLSNDIRLNKALRILSIRWLLSLRKNFTFDFNKHLKTISYYLSPTPFDSLDIRNEKIKSLFIFLHQNDASGSEFIIKSLSIFDNYKYFPIFSKHIKSLFKAYLMLVIRFPYSNIIELLGFRIKNNLKEVPRLLPNVISLLRNIKVLGTTIIERDLSNNQMSYDEIYRCLLVDMADFIACYNSHSRLNSYFELFIELSKENSIEPFNIIKALRNLYNAIQDLRNWKIEKNILEVCKYLLEYHDLNTVKKYNIQLLLDSIKTHSFDYGIREQAKLYYELVANVEKPLLINFIKLQGNDDHKVIDVTYNYRDYEDSIVDMLLLDQSKEERLKANLDDRGTAIYNCGSDPNSLFLSDNNQNILKSTFDHNMNFQDLNDYSKAQINDLVDDFIFPSDILRLFISNSSIDVSQDAMINENDLFHIDNQNPIKDKNLKTNQESIPSESLLDDYYNMLSHRRFYIKLPFNISLQESDNNIDKIFSLSLCFALVPKLQIISNILLPYLEKRQDNTLPDSFPYFYKTYLIVYPTSPIPSEITSRAIFYTEDGKCCTGELRPFKLSFEDFFLPITIPPKYQDKENTNKEFKEILFKSLWKKFKMSNCLNTNRQLEYPKEKIINKVNRKLGPFLLDSEYEKQSYIIKNPYTNTNIVEPNAIIKLNYNETNEEFNTNSYDFIMDNFLEMNYEKTSLNINGIVTNGRYILAKVLIFLPEHYHMLFKIKISDYSSMIEIRCDCKEIIEYFDDYFDSWEVNI